MFTLPILPDELRLPLDHVETEGVDENKKPTTYTVCKYPGVVAVVRPLDIEAASKWNDAFPGADERSLAATSLVQSQLITIEGLMMQDAATKELSPFDPENKSHRKSIPMDMRSGIYLGLKKRAQVEPVTEKNFDSPSGSDGRTSGQSIPAEIAQTKPETT